MIRCEHPQCEDQAIVQHRDTHQALCYRHAHTTLCAECGGMPATQCGLAGCGDWMPVSMMAQSLLLFEFEHGLDPDIPKH